MVILLSKTIGFWASLIAAIFIMLHIPSCNEHWASRLRPLSNVLRKYHNQTLILATIFALIHIVLSLIGLISGVWL